MTIRPAQAGDYSEIYSLSRRPLPRRRSATGPSRTLCWSCAGGTPHRPELELVAERTDKLIGHILLTILPVQGAPQGLRGLMVAPLCVRLEDRNRGLGGQLLHEGGRRAAELGYKRPVFSGRPRTTTADTASRTPSPWGSKTPPACPTSFCWQRGLTPDALRDAGGALAAPLKTRQKSTSVEEGLP